MWKTMRSKYDRSSCLRCYKKIHKGQMIEWHSEKKTVRHANCESVEYRYTYGGKGRKVA